MACILVMLHCRRRFFAVRLRSCHHRHIVIVAAVTIATTIALPLSPLHLWLSCHIVAALPHCCCPATKLIVALPSFLCHHVVTTVAITVTSSSLLTFCHCCCLVVAVAVLPLLSPPRHRRSCHRILSVSSPSFLRCRVITVAIASLSLQSPSPSPSCCCCPH